MAIGKGPETYREFLRNPISGMLFICLTAIGYLYVDSRNTLTKQINDLSEENKSLKQEIKLLNDRIIQIVKKQTTYVPPTQN